MDMFAFILTSLRSPHDFEMYERRLSFLFVHIDSLGRKQSIQIKVREIHLVKPRCEIKEDERQYKIHMNTDSTGLSSQEEVVNDHADSLSQI